MTETQLCNTQRCLTAEELSTQRVDTAVEFLNCDRSDVKFAISAALPLERSAPQRAASVTAPLIVAAACVLAGVMHRVSATRAHGASPQAWDGGSSARDKGDML